jgi:hypothetical protein
MQRLERYDLEGVNGQDEGSEEKVRLADVLGI